MKFINLKYWINEKDNNRNVVVLFPGGFKPTTHGHISLVKRYLQNPLVKEVKVLIGPGVRNGIDQDLSYKISKEFFKDFNNVEVEKVKYPSPILTAYKYMETAEPGTYAMASVRKGDDYERVLDFVKNLNPGGKYYSSLPKGVNVIELSVDTEPINYEGRTDDKEGMPISASILRRDVLNNDYENFKTNYPRYPEEVIKKIWELLKPNITEADEIEYKDELNEEEKSVTPTVNKHMTHAEDLVILGGEDGLRWVIAMFKELYTILKGYTNKNQIKLSVKFDGAPSVFIWNKFPELEKPGIAIKALFAKDPKLCFSLEDIDKYYSEQPSLAKKLKFLFPHISSLGVPDNQIWQGDFLFDKTTLIDEEGYYAFHPNTIVYKVKKNTEVAKKVEKADVGVVWHTRYVGTSLRDIRAQYNTKISELKENSKVFMTDPYIASFAGIITLTNDENKEITTGISDIEEKAKTLYESAQYKEIIENKELISLFTTFQNSLIKQNYKAPNSSDFLDKFKFYVANKFKQEEETKKSEKGKQAVFAKQEATLKKIEDSYKTFDLIVKIIIEITKLKNIFIKKLNNLNQFENYLKTKSGRFITTGEEGFAASDINGNIVKLVDRYEFSKANFSPDIMKGWTKE